MFEIVRLNRVKLHNGIDGYDVNLMEDIDDDIPFEVLQNAELAKLELLPIKSLQKYYRVYNQFKNWLEHGLKNVSAKVIMAYFFEMDKKP